MSLTKLISAIEIAPNAVAANSGYRKVCDRASYAFTLVSVAAGIQVTYGKIEDVRLALGGVSAKPWRASQAEAMLRGEKPTPARFLAAAEAEMAFAKPLQGNAFKVELAKRTTVAMLSSLAGVSA